MKRSRTVLVAAAFVVSLLVNTGVPAADVAVIVSKDNPAPVDKAMVQKIYLGKLLQWPGGAAVAAADLPESDAVRAAFTSGVLGKTVANVKAAWAEKIFSGKALPPKVFDSSEAVKKFVAGNRQAIGYITPSALDDTVRAVIK